MTVWIYDQGEELKVFATEDAARVWIDENDPEGVAFEDPVVECTDKKRPHADDRLGP